ncbi:Chromate resistance protein ChrB [Klenkia terrae]|uniref:Chromate resistance protein ChrB n=1 Tax=Klenkia terrae TaxID=1052259 RepID=UPI00361021BE
MLSYRLPREPSGPRTTLWRRLKRLGVGSLGDGVVCLPADARTREEFEWLAADVHAHGGRAGVWTARALTVEHEHQVLAEMGAARAAEYDAVAAAAATATAGPDPGSRRRELGRLRRELRAVARRDFTGRPERDAAERALAELVPSAAEVTAPAGDRS